eukprot:390521-Amphidinium_carterae.1
MYATVFVLIVWGVVWFGGFSLARATTLCRTIATVPQGFVGLAFDRGQPVILPPGGSDGMFLVLGKDAAGV